MPELPEVQTIVSDLNKKIKGDTIVGFWSDWKKAVKNISAKKFGKEIHSRKILAIRRIGKNIFIDLSGGKTIYIHLKMTGHLLVKIKNQKSKYKMTKQNAKCKFPSITLLKKGDGVDYFNDKVNQYVHHIFYLKTQNTKCKTRHHSSILPSKRGGDHIDHNKTLEFSDLRKFGKIVLVNTNELENLKEINNLGVDALSRKFTLKKFTEILNKRPNSLIGVVLMDQNLIAGIGNIYRSEILFNAQILPTRKIKDLKLKEIEKLFKSIKKIFKKAVKMRGTSDSDYRDTAGAPGGFHKVLKVYRREKRKCKKCGTIIKRIKLGQRSAYYCPRCQR